MNNYKITALDILVKNSLSDVKDTFTEDEIAKAIKALVIVRIIGIVIFTVFSILILCALYSVSDELSHFIYHYYGGFCEYYR
ncbi:hypothetical protein [Butyrivibrio sp. MB2005]|uniref:hypothetical protein n=1 Tax=Butyrivibrio sp. MB2005 TaxID=1280678 RepID=UPI0004128333|nr:hypothetical protein [Butyrivibrio sp. MB2005]